MKNKVSLFNAISNILVQLLNIISAFIIPKLILITFGSEVNGLVSSLNQFLNYIALLEGGLTSVVMASLYKPLYEKKYDEISSIIKTSSNFFKKISYVFLIYTILLAIVYPLIFDIPFSFEYVFTLTLILSLKLFVQYCFSFSLRNLLNADKKVHYVAFTQIFLIVIDIISAIIVVKFFPSIHILKLVSAIIFMLQPIIYNRIVKKYFNLDKNAKLNNELIKNRWDGFSINIAYFIHSNTDITILTIFENLKVISVYSVYALVSTGLKQIVSAFSNGISPSIGNLYAKADKKELNEKFDVIEYITFNLVFFLFIIGGLLITPFVKLYTKGVTDINYSQPLFGILILIAEGFFVIRGPYINLAYSAGVFKDLKKYAYFEAFLNIIVSITFVFKFGLIGVAIGTLTAMIYRTIYQVIYLKDHLINRPVSKFFKKLIIFASFSIVGIIICIKFLYNIKITVFSWIMHGIIYTIVFGLIYLIIGLLFYRKELKIIKEYLFRR